MNTLTTIEDVKLYNGELITKGTKLELNCIYSEWNTFQGILWKNEIYFIHSTSFVEVMKSEEVVENDQELQKV